MMKFFLCFFSLLSVTTYVLSETCGKNEFKKCFEGLGEVMNGAQEIEIHCGELRETKDCLLQFVNRCMSDKEQEGAKLMFLDKIVRNVEDLCPIEEQGTEKRNANDDDRRITNEERECLEDEERISLFVTPCVQESRLDFSADLPRQGFLFEDISCQRFLLISRCVARKTGEICGETVEQVLFNTLVLALRNDEEVSASPACSAALREAEADDRLGMRKRRSLRNISFAKLLP